MSIISCCKDCEKRRVGCHAECEQYNAEKNIIIEEQNDLKKYHAYSGRAYAENKTWNHFSLSGRSHKK